jgi:hypothetical protein
MQEEKEEIKDGTYIVTLRLFKEVSERLSYFMEFFDHGSPKYPELLKLKVLVARFNVEAVEAINFYRTTVKMDQCGKPSRREHKIPRAGENKPDGNAEMAIRK